jgi:hypothetical protein
MIKRYDSTGLKIMFPTGTVPEIDNKNHLDKDTEQCTWLRLEESALPGEDKGGPGTNIFGANFGLDRLQKALDCFDTLSAETTGSEAPIRLASSWLAECLENHKCCTPGSWSQSVLPSRVLDVGSSEIAPDIRLVETSSQVGKYLTLSHCWGGGTPIKTTTDNISQHLLRIKWSSLPRTFAEAVHLTRKLGIQYLWIDSLCIIQNSHNDWEKESAMMYQYYQNSLVTIAAADGNNSEAGLFRDRDLLDTSPCRLRIRHREGHFQEMFAFAPKMSFRRSQSNTMTFYMAKPLPLYGRAWVFQEQVLSPRILTYFRDSFNWRCQEMCFDEKPPLMQGATDFIVDNKKTNVSLGGDPRPVDTTIAELQQKWIYPRRSLDVVLDSPGVHGKSCLGPTGDFLLAWTNIVEDYTNRGLTIHSDKLIAIQGVAQAIAAVTGRKYFAGIWVDSPHSIFMGLLWCASMAKSRDRIRTGIAPSWSWASVSNPISWPGHWLSRMESRVAIIDLKMAGTPSKAEGELTIAAKVRPAIVENGRVARLAEWEDEKPGGYGQERMYIDRVKLPISLDEELGENLQVWFAELAAGEVPVRGSPRQVHCLVLVKISFESEFSGGKFKRVGYSTWEESTWNDVENLPKPREVSICLV